MGAHQPRQPRGVPVGGQWRATTRPEGRGLQAVPSGYYWWHRGLLKELRRIETGAGPLPSYNSKGLASNLYDQHTDVKRWLEELEDWGLVELAEPEWEVRGAKWYRLTDAGRALVGPGRAQA